jgi:hypothetical protein
MSSASLSSADSPAEEDSSQSDSTATEDSHSSRLSSAASSTQTPSSDPVTETTADQGRSRVSVDDCAICLELLNEIGEECGSIFALSKFVNAPVSAVLKLGGCGHRFHARCLVEMAASGDDLHCPLCRAVVAWNRGVSDELDWNAHADERVVPSVGKGAVTALLIPVVPGCVFWVIMGIFVVADLATTDDGFVEVLLLLIILPVVFILCSFSCYAYIDSNKGGTVHSAVGSIFGELFLLSTACIGSTAAAVALALLPVIYDFPENNTDRSLSVAAGFYGILALLACIGLCCLHPCSTAVRYPCGWLLFPVAIWLVGASFSLSAAKMDDPGLFYTACAICGAAMLCCLGFVFFPVTDDDEPYSCRLRLFLLAPWSWRYSATHTPRDRGSQTSEVSAEPKEEHSGTDGLSEKV